MAFEWKEGKSPWNCLHLFLHRWMLSTVTIDNREAVKVVNGKSQAMYDSFEFFKTLSLWYIDSSSKVPLKTAIEMYGYYCKIFRNFYVECLAKLIFLDQKIGILCSIPHKTHFDNFPRLCLGSPLSHVINDDDIENLFWLEVIICVGDDFMKLKSAMMIVI